MVVLISTKQSFAYKVNRIGERTQPWGAPILIDLTSDSVSFILTHWVRFVKKDKKPLNNKRIINWESHICACSPDFPALHKWACNAVVNSQHSSSFQCVCGEPFLRHDRQKLRRLHCVSVGLVFAYSKRNIWARWFCLSAEGHADVSGSVSGVTRVSVTALIAEAHPHPSPQPITRSSGTHRLLWFTSDQLHHC